MLITAGNINEPGRCLSLFTTLKLRGVAKEYSLLARRALAQENISVTRHTAVAAAFYPNGSPKPVERSGSWATYLVVAPQGAIEEVRFRVVSLSPIRSVSSVVLRVGTAETLWKVEAGFMAGIPDLYRGPIDRLLSGLDLVRLQHIEGSGAARSSRPSSIQAVASRVINGRTRVEESEEPTLTEGPARLSLPQPSPAIVAAVQAVQTPSTAIATPPASPSAGFTPDLPRRRFRPVSPTT